MNRTATFSIALLATGLSAVLLLATSSCDQKDVVQAKAPAPATAAAAAAPTAERLTERADARWKLIAKQEWIEGYEYLAPEIRQAMSLSQYIQGKSVHEYANPKVEEIVKLEKDLGYARITALWTPHHPALAKVKLEPGQTLTTEIEMIETWRFVGGDWYYLKAQKPDEFFERHPELLKKAPEESQGESK
jgi:hypothetical protein